MDTVMILCVHYCEHRVRHCLFINKFLLPIKKSVEMVNINLFVRT